MAEVNKRCTWFELGPWEAVCLGLRLIKDGLLGRRVRLVVPIVGEETYYAFDEDDEEAPENAPVSVEVY